VKAGILPSNPPELPAATEVVLQAEETAGR